MHFMITLFHLPLGLVVINILNSFVRTIYRSSQQPSIFISFSISFFQCFFQIIIKPSSCWFISPIVLKFSPCVLISIILHYISFLHHVTAHYICLFFITIHKIITSKRPHLMTINTFMESMCFLDSTYSITTRAFLFTNDYPNLIYKLSLLYLCKFTGGFYFFL